VHPAPGQEDFEKIVSPRASGRLSNSGSCSQEWRTTPENNALAGFFCSVCEAFVVGSVTWKATFLDDPEVVGALIAKDFSSRESEGRYAPQAGGTRPP
jgi:hypothetical protein